MTQVFKVNESRRKLPWHSPNFFLLLNTSNMSRSPPKISYCLFHPLDKNACKRWTVVPRAAFLFLSGFTQPYFATQLSIG